MASYIDCSDNESQECLSELIDRVNNQMTLSCQLPFKLPAAAIAQIIQEAKKWFYNNYEDAVEELYISAPGWVFKDPSFLFGLKNKEGMEGKNEIKKSETQKDRGVLVMPGNVFSVLRVFQLNRFSGEAGWGGDRIDAYNRDFSTRRMFASYMYSDSIAQSADNLLYWTCNWYYADEARQILQEMHGFSYNRLTKKLRFTGELPRYSCIFDVLCTIPDCDLFQDDLFFRYVVAQCLRQMSRILGTFTYSLPGNVSINYDQYSSWGETELQDIKDEIQNNRHSVAYFYTT